jgi:hypothetical protein
MATSFDRCSMVRVYIRCVTGITSNNMLVSVCADCIHIVLSFLSHKELRVVAQANSHLNALCNEPSLWHDLLRARTGRDIQTESPKTLYRKALRAGCPHILEGTRTISIHDEMAARRDIVRVSFDLAFVACITLDEQCLVCTIQEQLFLSWNKPVYRYVCRAEDARVTALGSWNKVTLLTLYHTDVTIHFMDNSTLQELSSVKLGLSVVAIVALYRGDSVIAALSTGDGVVCVECTYHPRVTLVEKNVHNGCVVGPEDRPRLCWTHDADRFFSIQGGCQYWLKDGVVFFSKRGSNAEPIEPTHWIGHVKELYGQHTETTVHSDHRWYRHTKKDIADVWFDGVCVLVRTRDGELYRLHADTPITSRVLWASNQCNSYTGLVVEP